jgi:ubiquinone/menaquinone biosynthesis C-methylase UbiE
MSGNRSLTARWYDGRVYAASIDRLLSGVRSYVVDRLPAGDRVLDACCGTGALSLQLARAGRRVVGVDLSPRHIEWARSHAEQAGLGPDRLRFELGDVAQLEPPKEGRFDVAVIVLSLHEMPDGARAPVVATLARVAKRVMIVDFTAPMAWNLAGVRNRTAELVAGPGHFAAFRSYSRNGGLEPLIGLDDLTVERDRTIDSGTLRVLTLTRTARAR